jgi:hypothetical protein
VRSKAASTLLAASTLSTLFILSADATPAHAAVPPKPSGAPVSLALGGSWHTPVDFSAAGRSPVGGSGTRIGLAFPTSLRAGDLDIPVEWGPTLRTASVRFDDRFGRMVFTDIQMPVLFHGAPFAWRPFELIAAWTPFWTLDLVSTDAEGNRIAGGGDLRTRFNMGFGGGAQFSARGFRLRSYAAYNIFPAFAGSTFKTSDWILEVAIPLARRKSAP